MDMVLGPEKQVDVLRPISIAITALGGQGGGVLADWIVDLGEKNGYVAQSTSVPGVAQRTGATIYYIELFPKVHANSEPVLALMPMAGEVDIVISSELMEAGRAMLRGFVTPDRTTLIASTHREYAISEKSAMADGIVSSDNILRAANEKSKAFLAFDMASTARRTESVISAVLFGALAASGRLPFAIGAFEQTITDAGIAVTTNIAGFREGLSEAKAMHALPAAKAVDGDAPLGTATTAAGKRVLDRISDRFPIETHTIIGAGVRRLADYQDQRYADLYLTLLEPVLEEDRRLSGGADGFALTNETGRYLALWMSYEDTIRVADLKIRSSRFARVGSEVRLKPDQLLQISEFMSPRIEEVCDTLPARVGSFIAERVALKAMMAPFLAKGRRIETTKLSGFLVLHLLASLRIMRRGTLKYREEHERIADWLARVKRATKEDDLPLALEIVECQRLIKGYGDTFARGLQNYRIIMSVLDGLGAADARADIVRRLRDAALADEMGLRLKEEIGGLPPCPGRSLPLPVSSRPRDYLSK